MGEVTEISWCDMTFNPWSGCTKVSPGCANCYAETMCNRFPHLGNWGPGADRLRTSEANWRKPLAWNNKAGAEDGYCARCGQASSVHGCSSSPACSGFARPPRPRVFCASLADWLDPEVSNEWLHDLLVLIGETPHLDWLLLTKRPHLWRERMQAALDWSQGEDARVYWVIEWLAEADEPELQGGSGVPPNVWIGTTVEDQQRADERIPELLKIPARVRFLSCEPLLGPVDVRRYMWPTCWTWDAKFKTPELALAAGAHAERKRQALVWAGCRFVDWVICGGESGNGARPMNPEWARSLRDQCVAAGVPFHFKQHGTWVPGVIVQEDDKRESMCFQGEKLEPMVRVGKKVAGRELDGRTWDEFPVVSA